jgi:hypothetical protein
MERYRHYKIGVWLRDGGQQRTHGLAQGRQASVLELMHERPRAFLHDERRADGRKREGGVVGAMRAQAGARDGRPAALATDTICGRQCGDATAAEHRSGGAAEGAARREEEVERGTRRPFEEGDHRAASIRRPVDSRNTGWHVWPVQ